MNLAEYAKYDDLGLAELVARKQVSPKELTDTAARAIEVANPVLKAVVELYADRIEGLDEKSLGDGPFRGGPFGEFGPHGGPGGEFGPHGGPGCDCSPDNGPANQSDDTSGPGA